MPADRELRTRLRIEVLRQLGVGVSKMSRFYYSKDQYVSLYDLRTYDENKFLKVVTTILNKD